MNHAENLAIDRSSRYWDRIAERYARQPIIKIDQLHRDIAECGFTLSETQLPTKPSRGVFLIAAKVGAAN